MVAKTPSGGTLDLDDIWNTTLDQGESQFAHVVPTKEAIIAYKINTYVPPILLTLGTLGNSVTFLALGRRHLQQDSLCFYLAVTVVSNTVALYLSCGLEWLSVVTGHPHVATVEDWICKVWDFSRKVFESSASWLLVAMSVDRFLALRYPLHARSFCSVFVAKFITALIFVVLVAIHIHSMWTVEVVTYHSQKTCSLNNTQRDFETLVWPYLAASLSYYLPSVIILVFVCFQLCGTHCFGRLQNRDEYQMRLAYTSLVVAVAFLLWSLPSLIHILLPYVMPADWLFDELSPVNFPRWRLAYTIIQTFKYAFFSLEFAVCLLCLPSLQTELRLMLSQLFNKKPRNNGLQLRSLGDTSSNDIDEDSVSRQELSTTASYL